MSNTEVRMGVVGGICFSVFGQLPAGILQTVFLAALGAIVSFAVSRILQWLVKNNYLG